MVEFGDLGERIERAIWAGFPAGMISRVHVQHSETFHGDEIIEIKVVLADKKRLDAKRAFYLNAEISRVVRECTKETAAPLVSYYSLKDARGIVPEAA